MAKMKEVLVRIKQYFTKESQDRASGDSALDTKIETEKTTRSNEITRVEGLVTAEENRAKGVENSKADKVANGTENNIVLLDANGNIKDSGKSLADTGKIDTISIDGVDVPADQNKNVDLPPYPTRVSLLINNVDNTSDANKPVSTAQQTAIDSTGHKINLEIDNTTFKLKAKLYDKNNTLLSTSDEIDLPLESVVVGGSYEPLTKQVVLTLQNGTTIAFSVADLIYGLQSEITANNPLSSDLVSDTGNAHKFVSASEKAQITTNQNDIAGIKNGTDIDSFADVESALEDKQDTISDLATIRSGASAGAAAVQDNNYVHTDNNYTTAEKTKLGGIELGAEVNVLEEIEIGTSADIGSVGTPSVDVSTSGKKTTLTFHNLKGQQGVKGDTGATGPQGPQGEKGATGSTGPQGPAGNNGTNGVSCTHSWSGTTLTITSASGTSSANLKGEKGDKGETGSAGTNGTNGRNGYDFQYNWDGTRLGVKNSSQSTYTYVDLKGAKGDNGSNGTNGTNGKDGLTTSIKVNNTTYTQSGGLITLPNYPTTLPASDVYSWAKASSKPSYSDSELTNNRYVRFDTASQGLNSTQKSNARTNIGAGTSDFTGYTSSNKLSTAYISGLAAVATSGSYNDLSDKPTIPTAQHLYRYLIGMEIVNGDLGTNFEYDSASFAIEFYLPNFVNLEEYGDYRDQQRLAECLSNTSYKNLAHVFPADDSGLGMWLTSGVSDITRTATGMNITLWGTITNSSNWSESCITSIVLKTNTHGNQQEQDDSIATYFNYVVCSQIY